MQLKIACKVTNLFYLDILQQKMVYFEFSLVSKCTHCMILAEGRGLYLKVYFNINCMLIVLSPSVSAITLMIFNRDLCLYFFMFSSYKISLPFFIKVIISCIFIGTGDHCCIQTQLSYQLLTLTRHRRQ